MELGEGKVRLVCGDSAAAWSNDVPGLTAALAPLEQAGVRFVSPSAGLRCVE